MKVNDELLDDILRNGRKILSYEEVIEIIKDLSDRGYKSYRRAKEIAIEALGKQISKELKVVPADIIISGEIYHDDYYHCPCCDKCFGTLWYVEDNAKTLKTKCCPDCGQALNWE